MTMMVYSNRYEIETGYDAFFGYDDKKEKIRCFHSNDKGGMQE
jgi:hypothetical protein